MSQTKTVTMEEYERLVADRPSKFSEDEVDFRPAEGSGFWCWNCIHYYLRTVDGQSVCEIMRSRKVDEDGVPKDWQCKFWTSDGRQFPLLKQAEKD